MEVCLVVNIMVQYLGCSEVGHSSRSLVDGPWPVVWVKILLQVALIEIFIEVWVIVIIVVLLPDLVIEWLDDPDIGEIMGLILKVHISVLVISGLCSVDCADDLPMRYVDTAFLVGFTLLIWVQIMHHWNLSLTHVSIT